MKKRIISLLLVLLLSLSLCPAVFASSGQSLENAAQVTTVVTGNDFTITKGTLRRGDVSEPVYLITLHGTTDGLSKHNNAVNYLLGLVPLNNSYFQFAKKTILKNITEPNAKLLLAGHSQGGMVAQMLAGDAEMRSRYEIINVLACGSPYIPQLKREGTLHRLANLLDPIPVISSTMFGNYLLYVSFEASRPYSTLVGYHTNYEDEAVWGKYDCLGVKNGGAVFTPETGTLEFSLKIR